MRHKCPVCRKFEFSEDASFEICNVCGWNDDIYQVEFPDDDTGANKYSLNEYKMKYKAGWVPDWIKEKAVQR